MTEDEDREMFSKILVATDGSQDALHAADVAGELATRFGSCVTLLSVYSPSPISNTDFGVYEVEDAIIRDVHAAVLSRTAAAFVKRDLEFEARQETGNPAAVIVNVAEQEHMDLIVVGRHGMGGLRRFLLGSVSDRVAHYAHCPVLIVKPENHK
jgi:nucleotide-binding universal stress UspA family protein